MTSATACKSEPTLTVNAFLDWDGEAGAIYDLVDGQPRLHAAPMGTHATIHARLTALLTNLLDASKPGCRVMTGAGVRPGFRADWNFRVPDLVITCARNEHGEREAPLPVLIVECLSPSNTAETWDKVRNSMTIASVQAILVFHTTRVAADVLLRQADGSWGSKPFELGQNDVIAIAALNIDVPVKAAYRESYLE